MVSPDIYCVAGTEIFFFGNTGEPSRPLIFMLHGLKANAMSIFHYCRSLEEEGYNVITLDQRNHGRRYIDGRCNSCTGEHTAVNLLGMLAGIAKDISLILDFAPMRLGLSPKSVGMTGISLGGHATLVTMMLEKRINVGVSIIGTGEFVSLFKQCSLMDEAAAKNLDHPMVKRILKLYNPVNSPDTFSDRPLLMLNGEDDDIVTVDSAKRFAKKVSKHYTKPERFQLKEYTDTAHEVIGEMWDDTRNWFKKWL